MYKRGLLFALIIIPMIACTFLGIDPQSPAKPTQITKPNINVSTPRPTKVKQYGVGELVVLTGGAVEGINATFILDSVDFIEGYDGSDVLVTNFTIENRGTKPLLLRSSVMFTAKDDDGVILEENIVDCGSNYLDDLDQGEKVKGEKCWYVTSSPPYLIYFDHYFVSGAIIWKVSP